MTHVSSTTSAGLADFEIRPQRTALAQFERTDDFIFADQSVAGSVAIGPWLSLAVRARGLGIIPRSAVGAVAVGARSAYGGNAIAAVRLLRSRRLQATVIADFGYLWTTDVIPLRLPDSPYVRGDVSTIRPALAIAYTVSRRIGLQASASLAWRWFDVGQEDRVRTLDGGAALTIGLDPAPFMLLVAGQLSHDFGRDVTTVTSNAVFGTGESRAWGEAGLVFRGRRELDIGATFIAKLDDIDDNSRWFAQFRLAYYF